MSNVIDRHPSGPDQGVALCSVRTVPLSLDEAWDAWTTPGGLQAWWWPEDADVTYRVDPRVGGRYRIHSASTGLGAGGTFLAVDRPRQLRLQWRWLGEYGPNEDDLVQVSFAVDEGDVVVRVEHTLAAGTGSERCAEHWNEVLDSLASLSAIESLVCPRCGCAVDGDPAVCTGLDCLLSNRALWASDELPVPLVDY